MREQNAAADRKALAGQCLAALQTADPSASDYAEEIESIYKFLNNIEGFLGAESAYRYALAATSTAPHQLVHLDLLLRHGALLVQGHREVEAARVYSEALELVQAMPDQKGLYGGTLVTLAALNEKMGLLIEAEKLYRRAVGLPPYPGNSFHRPQMFSMLEGERKDWEDFELALTRFLARSHRYEEAEQIHKDRVARATGADKATCLRDYIFFLQWINRAADTVALYQQVLAINELGSGGKGRADLHSDLTKLIRIEQGLGNEEAAQSVRARLVLYDRETARPEYESDLHEYADALLRSGYFEEAERVINDEIAAADRKSLATAMWHKVGWMHIKGNEDGAKRLEQEIAALPSPYAHLGKPFPESEKAGQMVGDILRLVCEGRFEDAYRDLDELWPLIESEESNVRPDDIDKILTAFAKMNRQQEGAEIL